MPNKLATVSIWLYPETRRRINTHAAAKEMRQADYLDSIVPPLPGEQSAEEK